MRKISYYILASFILSSCTVIKIPSEDVVKYYPGLVYISSDDQIAYDAKSTGLIISKKQLHIGIVKEQTVINPLNNQTYIFNN